jgi:hypothetical protein
MLPRRRFEPEMLASGLDLALTRFPSSMAMGSLVNPFSFRLQRLLIRCVLQCWIKAGTSTAVAIPRLRSPIVARTQMSMAGTFYRSYVGMLLLLHT